MPNTETDTVQYCTVGTVRRKKRFWGKNENCPHYNRSNGYNCLRHDRREAEKQSKKTPRFSIFVPR
jgi:hypothetical protein